MKVAIDASPLVINRASGLSEVLHNLLLHLPAASNNGQFTLFLNYFRSTRSKEDISYLDADNHVLRFPRRLIDNWWKHDWPPFDLYLKGIDVFHSLHISVPPTKKMKTVLTVHDCRYLALPDLYEAQEVKNYRQQMQRSLKRVDMIATVSQFTRNELLSYFSYPEDRIRVIYNGFEPFQSDGRYDQERVDLFIEKLDLPHSYLLYTGVLDPRKNLGRLIEAIAGCKKNREEFPELLIAGTSFKDWIRSEYASRAKDLGVFEQIRVCGVVEKDILVGLTRRAHALCYPSLYEGFGFPPLEAMSLGVPVIAGSSSSIPEITAGAACLVDPADVDDITQGLNRIVFDSDYRQFLIESGYRQATKFSWQKAAAEYISLYKEVLAA
jgi:glycosyltransferase involved in cell wall biosynthesis